MADDARRGQVRGVSHRFMRTLVQRGVLPAKQVVPDACPSPQSEPGRVIVASLLVETTESSRAGDDLCSRPRAGAGLPRTSRTGPREPRAPPATQRLETHGPPSAAPEARSPLLGRIGPDVAELAR